MKFEISSLRREDQMQLLENHVRGVFLHDGNSSDSPELQLLMERQFPFVSSTCEAFPVPALESNGATFVGHGAISSYLDSIGYPHGAK